MAVQALPGTAADAILGVQPNRVFRPMSLDEAEEAVRACARDRLRLAFIGGGTELELGAPPSGLDAVLYTAGLGRVLEYAPLDQIVTVEAGVPLQALQAKVRSQQQMLALDPPWAERATVGGVVATNAFGAHRTRYGSVRDLIIGVTLVRADGTRAKGGGKVVKNVAGFDLPKLMVGSLGSLGLIGTATFRLHPLPETSSTTRFPKVSPEAVGHLVAALYAGQLEPAAVAVLWTPQGVELGCCFEGFEAGVLQQRDRLSTIASTLGMNADVLDARAAEDFWRRHAAVREAPAAMRAKVATLPAASPRAAGEAWDVLRDVLQAPRAVLYPTVGLGFIAGDVPDAGALALAVARTRQALAGLGGHLVLHAAPPALRAPTEVWGPAPAATFLFQRVKDALDPEHRLAVGRLAGGL